MNNSSGFVTPAPTFTFKRSGMRVEVDYSGEQLGKQIRTAELEKIPVVAVIGQKEVENQTLSIRTRQNGDLGVLTIDEILPRLQEAIAWGWYPTHQE